MGMKNLIPSLCRPLLINPNNNEAMKALTRIKISKKVTRNPGVTVTSEILSGKEPCGSLCEKLLYCTNIIIPCLKLKLLLNWQIYTILTG